MKNCFDGTKMGGDSGKNLEGAVLKKIAITDSSDSFQIHGVLLRHVTSASAGVQHALAKADVTHKYTST